LDDKYVRAKVYLHRHRSSCDDIDDRPNTPDKEESLEPNGVRDLVKVQYLSHFRAGVKACHGLPVLKLEERVRCKKKGHRTKEMARSAEHKRRAYVEVTGEQDAPSCSAKD
jgi:hypothetical protein